MVHRSRNPDTFIHQRTTLDYWNGVSATNDGMLGGFQDQSTIDLEGSRKFLAKLRQPSAASQELLPRAVDCGAGIGRITSGFLSNVAQTVDIVEPVEKFTRTISEGDEFRELRNNDRIGKVYNEGLQSWTPAKSTYDLIWNQWCLLYLKDVQLIAYLRRCKEALTNGGWIVIKENIITEDEGPDIFDNEDSSVTRTDKKYRALFGKAGLKLVATELQENWPKSLFPVGMYALQPES